MSTGRNRFVFEAEKDVFVAFEDRLQGGESGDQATRFEVFLGGPQTQFEVSVADQVLVPEVASAGVGQRGGSRGGSQFERLGGSV